MAFYVAWRTKFVKGTFGHSRKYVDDRINPIFFVPHGKTDDFNAKSEKGSIQEPVHKEQLA